MSYTINVTNSYFDLVYTLTQQQKNNTIVAYPGGFYYLTDITDSKNLGNNTIVQNDYSNNNVNITNTNQLVFNNRFIPSTGIKTLGITFNTGSPNYIPYIIERLTYNATTLTQPYYAKNNLNNSQINLTEKTSTFNLVYTLTSQQIADTITVYPNGFYYLSDNTDNKNLGNNTIVQNDYSNINVNITNTNQLVFNNRFIPSTGIKNLNIKFNYGTPSYYSVDVQGTNFTYNAETLQIQQDNSLVCVQS
jgi:hypothetical protein